MALRQDRLLRSARPRLRRGAFVPADRSRSRTTGVARSLGPACRSSARLERHGSLPSPLLSLSRRDAGGRAVHSLAPDHRSRSAGKLRRSAVLLVRVSFLRRDAVAAAGGNQRPPASLATLLIADRDRRLPVRALPAPARFSLRSRHRHRLL